MSSKIHPFSFPDVQYELLQPLIQRRKQERAAGYGFMSESGQETEKEELHATRTGEEGLLGNLTLLLNRYTSFIH